METEKEDEESETKEQKSCLVGKQISNDGVGPATPSGNW